MSNSALWEQFENDNQKSKKAKKEDRRDKLREIKVKCKDRRKVLHGRFKSTK